MTSCLVILSLLVASAVSQMPPRPPPCSRRGQCGRSSNFKWVFCNNEWKRVTKEDCNAVFVEPTLEVCNSASNKDFFKNFPSTSIYVWNVGGEPLYHYCKELPTCFCSACGTSSSSSTTAKPSQEGCTPKTGEWKRVRHVPEGNSWHPVNDDLRGNARPYGNPLDDSKPWSLQWKLSDFDEFLFASGNMKYWLIATKDEIVGADGERKYANLPINIISSYKSCSPYTAKMYRRFPDNAADPLVSAQDHHSTGGLLYGEDTYSGKNHLTKLLREPGTNGFDVYIRKR